MWLYYGLLVVQVEVLIRRAVVVVLVNVLRQVVASAEVLPARNEGATGKNDVACSCLLQGDERLRKM
jgi:hypothetical protein